MEVDLKKVEGTHAKVTINFFKLIERELKDSEFVQPRHRSEVG